MRFAIDFSSPRQITSFSLNPARMTTPSSDADGAKANRELIDTLRRAKLFRNYEQVCSEATGLPLALRPVDYWQLENQGKKNQNPFCAMLAKRPATLAVCLQAHQDII